MSRSIATTSYEGAKDGPRFGQPVETHYDLSKADVIVSLDADFLYAGFPGNVRYIRDFAARRTPDAPMNRPYAIESTPSSTGAKADHRWPVRFEEMLNWLRQFGEMGGTIDGRRRNPIAQELMNHIGSSVIIVGDHLPPEVHAIAHVYKRKQRWKDGFLPPTPSTRTRSIKSGRSRISSPT